MRGMPFNLKQEEGSSFWIGVHSSKKRKGFLEGFEPCSVLDHRRSPSPSAATSSSSALSSSLAGGSDSAAVAAVPEDPAAKRCPPSELPDIGGVEDWGAIISDSAQEQTFLQWVMADSNANEFDSSNWAGAGFGVVDPPFGFEPTSKVPSFDELNSNPFPPPMELFDSGSHQNPSFFVPPFSVQHVEPTRRIPPRPEFPDSVPFTEPQALVDQLFKAAELIEAGNSVIARGILARLNQQLPSPIGKPLLRSAYYFKEALLRLLLNGASSLPAPPTNLLDVVLKLGTYKAFSEVSPVVQFTNFTCIQTLLEELDGSDRIHIVDFDIGIGGQWSSFMQELAQQRPSRTPFLKITAFVSQCSHHPLELHLTRDNLSHFATDLNIPFEFNVLSLDPFDPSILLGICSVGDESIAVNLPVGSSYHPPLPTLLPLMKQLSPRIVVSVDHGCDRSDLSFSHQFLHAFQSSTVLLDSIDAAGTDPDVANKIERFLLQPRIERALLERHRAPTDKMPPWRALFASSGFVPLRFSNFTETQAECLLKRVQVRGFHVEKRQASLFLGWQRGELVSVSAWR